MFDHFDNLLQQSSLIILLYHNRLDAELQELSHASPELHFFQGQKI